MRVVPILGVAAVAFAFLPLDCASAAYAYKTPHSLCSRSNCLDGAGATGRLVVGQGDVLYGTTQEGGKYLHGVLFKLVPNADRSAYKEYVLHNFCRTSTCVDGFSPEAGVILDIDGNIYGTAPYGGAYGQGTIFKLTHGSNGWFFSVLKDLCAESVRLHRWRKSGRGPEPCRPGCGGRVGRVLFAFRHDRRRSQVQQRYHL